jgi:hypothetical protein
MNSRTAPGPTWHCLFHGAIRESLAAVNSVARIGIQDTHAWESPIRYVADDNEGNVGIVEFQPDRAIGAVSARTPGRVLDQLRAIDRAPPEVRDSLLRLSELPLLQEGSGVTEIFWTVGESIQGPESWDEMCLHGLELFEHELLSDSEWELEGTAFYELTPDVARLVIAVAARAMVRAPMLHLSEHELKVLVPKNSKHESVARDLLLSDGLFQVALGASA